MAEFIISNGQTGALTDTSPTTIKFTVDGKLGDLEIVNLTEVTMNLSKDVFTRTQMNHAGKRQFPTTSNYSLSTNISIDKDEWKGIVADASNVAGSASVLGLYKLLETGKLVTVVWNMGDIVHTAPGYITGANPGATADQPIWTTPLTITITGGIVLS